jgi:pyridoxamine 5'-phosphate oxidase-like protein
MQDLRALARGIIDGNRYLTLATVGDDGRPWASPVFYAAGGYRDFYWISSPETVHSLNILRRPDVAIVIFDSQAPAYEGQAVYMEALAEELRGADLERGLSVYPGPPENGGLPVPVERVQAPSPYRLYQATAARHWVLCPRDSGPCEQHGLTYDHRTEVTP